MPQLVLMGNPRHGVASAHCSEGKPNIRGIRYLINIVGLESAFRAFISVSALNQGPSHIGWMRVMEAASLYKLRIPRELSAKVKGSHCPERDGQYIN